MTCDNNTTTQAYVGPDAPDVTVGCLPSGLGEPTAKPESDQLPFYYDTKSESLYFFNCESNIWIKQNQVVGDLPSIDTDVISDICNVLQIPISYILNDCVSEGNVTLGTLANHIAECLGLEKRFSDLENRNPIKSISTGEDGKVTVTYIDGTTKALQIDTDQVTKVSENSNEIVYTNEDGTQFKVTATAIKRLIANDYVDNDELVNALSSLDPDQVTKFAITGTNLIITNEDGSSVSVKRTDMVNWLNAGLATDVELANAITAINTDQAKLELESSDLKLTNEDGTSSSVSLSALTKALRGGDGINTSNGEINVCLSRDDGNLLELREDPDTGEVCLYFGIQAPPNVSNLYVKNDGDDSADGTKEAPLRTLREALSRSPRDKSNTIHLYSGDTFYLDKTYTVDGAINRRIQAYGGDFTPDSDLYKEVVSNNVTVYWYRSTNFERPKILTKWRTTPYAGAEAQRTDGFLLINGATLSILGCEIVLVEPAFDQNQIPVTGFNSVSFVYGNGVVDLRGVIVDDTDSQNRSMLSGLNVTHNLTLSFDMCKWVGADYRNLDPYRPAFSFIGSATITISDGNGVSTDSIETQYGLNALDSNMKTEVVKPRMVSPIVRDSSGTIINIQSNVNL